MRLRFLLINALALAACSTNPSGPGAETCGPYPDWSTSPYVLPYPVGRAYTVIQANCSPQGQGHRGVARHGYDFNMTIGSVITAARAGIVTRVVESHFDGEIAPTGLDNFAVVQHADGTLALYGHFTHDGVSVIVGGVVQAGDTLGFSGNTGNTGNIPHLHFSVHPCDVVELGSDACDSLPVTFRNTDPNPDGLVRGRSYTAQAF